MVLNRNFLLGPEKRTHHTPSSPARDVVKQFSSEAPSAVWGLRSAPAQPVIAPDTSPLSQHLSFPNPW